MADFDPDQIKTIRTDYIRDLVDAQAGTYLSHFNRSTQGQYVTDASLNAHKATMERDWSKQLARVYRERYCEAKRTSGEQDMPDALASAAQLEALMGLVAAKVLTSMLEDSGFLAYTPPDVLSAWVSSTRQAVRRYQTFPTSRSGIGSRQLERR